MMTMIVPVAIAMKIVMAGDVMVVVSVPAKMAGMPIVVAGVVPVVVAVMVPGIAVSEAIAVDSARIVPIAILNRGHDGLVFDRLGMGCLSTGTEGSHQAKSENRRKHGAGSVPG